MYPYLNHCLYTGAPMIRTVIQALYSENQGSSRAWLGCSLWSWCGLGLDPYLPDMVHDSYNTHEMVGYHIHTCIIIIGPLHHRWGSLFKILVPISRVTAEHIWGVVCGHVVVCRVISPWQTYFMTHITLIKWWDIISIPAWSFLDYYITDDDHCSSSWFQ